jgi:hypothetical protein
MEILGSLACPVATPGSDEAYNVVSTAIASAMVFHSSGWLAAAMLATGTS